MGLSKLGYYIRQIGFRNIDEKYSEDNVVGISTQKMMILTKADLMGVKLTSYKLVPPNHFAYVSDTSRRGDKMSLCFNNTNQTYLVSSISTVFYVYDTENLSSDYLFMYFNRPEFDRYSRFNSWGSAREMYNYEDIIQVQIPIPQYKIQQSIVNIYNSYIERKAINEKLKAQIKDICPILIKGSIEEARGV